MCNILKSYWLRNKRTSARWIAILSPIIFSVLFVLYVLESETLKGIEIDVFFLLYVILASFSMSFIIPAFYETDKTAGRFANDLRGLVDRKKVFIARFLYLCIVLLIIGMNAVFIASTILYSMGVNMSLIDILILYTLSSITLMMIIPVYQFVSLLFSYSGSILLGAFCTLSGILLGTTGLGEKIWCLLPFVWPIKLTFAYTNEEFSSGYILIFFLLSILITGIHVWLFSIWFNRWDGIAKIEE